MMAGARFPPRGPLRTLAVTSAVSAAGTSLTVTTLVLYTTRIVGLSGGQAALGLTLGGLLGLLISLPLGHLADRLGARGLLVALTAAQAVATVGYVLVDSFAAYLAVVIVDVALLRGASAVRQGVVARALPIFGRVRSRAYLRAVTNVGFAAGAALATVGIAVGTRTGYQAMFALDALSFLVVAGLLLGLPRLPRIARAGSGPQLVVLHDRPYLAVVALTAVMAVHDSMLDVGLALWVTHTSAPATIVGVIFVVNCVVVALFSVRVAGDADAPADAARAARRAGVSVLLACVLLATASTGGVIVAAVVLVGGMLLQALAEMQAAAAQWGLMLGLAPEELQGQYQGAAATGIAVARMVGPLAMAAIVVAGTLGWLAFGLLLTAVGAATVPTARWAAATRTIPDAAR